LNNYDWWKKFSLLDFLRDVGKYARVGTMMAKESVKTRLNSEEGMSYTEFTYQLLQGYDFVHLFKVRSLGCSSCVALNIITRIITSTNKLTTI
jgi:tyrosyl-tRNA synthetase